MKTAIAILFAAFLLCGCQKAAPSAPEQSDMLDGKPRMMRMMELAADYGYYYAKAEDAVPESNYSETKMQSNVDLIYFHRLTNSPVEDYWKSLNLPKGQP